MDENTCHEFQKNAHAEIVYSMRYSSTPCTWMWMNEWVSHFDFKLSPHKTIDKVLLPTS